jgi:hypothetical protein
MKCREALKATFVSTATEGRRCCARPTVSAGARHYAITVAACAILVLAGCTSWSDYIHNGFKVGPNYGGRQPPSLNIGSTRPTSGSTR